MNTRSYHELSQLKTFEERFEYLKLSARIGEETFGTERFLNQYFYGTPEWRALRQNALIRDQGCDLGIEDHPIGGRIEVHHINPITAEDIRNRDPCLLDLENVICVSSNTHKAIHYGDASLLPHDPIERKPNDTCPWKL
ncbi:MAG: hypothetical protein LIR46_05055 [Bacteroidota bacterium]|nr:hypothetical protein [Bacteroidota bacterium]